MNGPNNSEMAFYENKTETFQLEGPERHEVFQDNNDIKFKFQNNSSQTSWLERGLLGWQ